MLILVSGLPGSGKTTLARAVAARCGMLHLNSDGVRREMGLMGRYAPEDKAAVYQALLDYAHKALASGRNVLIDSTFYREAVRAPFRELAEAAHTPLCWIEVRASESVIRQRLQTPRPDSEADFAVYEKIRNEAEPIPEPHLVLHSDEMEIGAMTDAAQAFLENTAPLFTEAQIRELAPGYELLETHISWVLLGPDYVFKIKKPVKFSFLDFSTPAKRAFYCYEELRLNRRLAPQMYLDVQPIAANPNGRPAIGESGGIPLDFAVRMRRMDDSRQMDKLLINNAVTPDDMRRLAALLSGFHRAQLRCGTDVPYQPGDNRADFEDLFQLEPVYVRMFGAEAASHIPVWRELVERFLDAHEPRLHARAEGGFWVEGHGDLHGRNIFLLPEGPVVFDCVEFNPHFRLLDVLNDLAFLCMELDADGHHELERVFMEAYQKHWNCMENAEDRRLFRYFKAYRANVRLKVTLLAWQQHPAENLRENAVRYRDLLEKYLKKLSI